MHPSAERVQAALAAAGYDGTVRELTESTRTADEAAAAAGCAVGQIAKSLVFKLEPANEAILILASGANRVHEKHVGKLLGGKLVRPDADFVRETTGFAIGGIPPLGHKTKIKTYMDEDLMQYDEIWGAAGTPNAVFPIAPQKMQQMCEAEIINIK